MSEWITSQIKDFGRVITGYTPSTSNLQLWAGDIPFYSPTDFNDSVYCTKTERTINSSAISNDRIVQKNSLMVTCIASIGKIALATRKGITNQQINAILFNENFDPKYCYYLIKNNINELIKLGGTTAVPIVNKADFEKISLRHHSDKSEQRKIAQILTTADAVIESTQAALAKYQAIKQGLLHDLFTRGIDPTTNQVRPLYEYAPHLYRETKLGMVPKEWEEEELINYCDRISVGIATSSTEYFSEQGVMFLRNQNIKENIIDITDILYISQEFADANSSKYLKVGDIITVRTGYPGLSAVVEAKHEGAQTFTTLITTPKKSELNSYFLAYFINSEFGRKQVLNLQGGSAQQNLNAGALETMNISKPCLKEQDEIVKRLKLCEKNINTEQTYLHKLQALKKGLMEDLLSGNKQVNVTEVAIP